MLKMHWLFLNFRTMPNTLHMLWTLVRWNTSKGFMFRVAPGRRRVDVLIGQSDKSLLTVLEEREGMDPEEPNYVLTRLGPLLVGAECVVA